MQSGDVQKQIENYANAQDGTPSREDGAVSDINPKVYPSTTEPPQKPKKILWKRILKVALICLGVFAVFLFICWLLAILLPGDTTTVQYPINIGTETITEEDVSSHRGALQEVADKFDGEVSFGDGADDIRDIDEIALDDLIMNVALKDAAISCEIPLSIDESLSVRGQNEEWKNVLEDCLIAKKNITVVGVVFDSPYFSNMSDDEANDSYEYAKKWLRDTIVPLMASGISPETISTTDGLSGFSSLKNPEDGILHQEIFAMNAICDSQECFNDDFDENKKFPGNLGQIVNQNDITKTLVNPGDYTEEPFTASSGIFGAMRLESKNDANFSGWDEFLSQYKDEYLVVQTSTSAFVSIKEIAANIVQFFLPFVNVSAAPCAKSHNNVSVFFGVKYVSVSGDWAWVGSIQPAALNMQARCDDAPIITVNSAADGTTPAFSNADCMNYAPRIYNIQYKGSSDFAIDHINFYCGASQRTCEILAEGTSSDINCNPSKELCTYNCTSSSETTPCAVALKTPEEVASVQVSLGWKKGANTTSDQVRVGLYITDVAQRDDPDCWDPVDGVKRLMSYVLQRPAEFPNPVEGELCRPIPPPEDENTSTPSEGNEATSQIRTSKANNLQPFRSAYGSWGTGAVTIYAHHSITSPNSSWFNDSKFINQLNTRNDEVINFRHNIDVQANETGTFSSVLSYRYQYPSICGYWIPFICYKTAYASTSKSKNYAFYLSKGLTITRRADTPVGSNGTQTNVNSGFSNGRYAKTDIWTTANTVVPISGLVNAGRLCQKIDWAYSQSFSDSVTAYAHSGAINPYLPSHTETKNVTLSKSGSSLNACFVVPFLWAVNPWIDRSNNGINDSKDLEVGEKIKVPWRIEAASNSSNSSLVNACGGASGFIAEAYITLNGVRIRTDYSNNSSTISCNGIISESELTGTSVGDEICLRVRVNRLSNDPYIIQGAYPGALGSYLEIGGRELSDCYSVTKRATIQIHGADSWSGTDFSNKGGFYAKNAYNDLNLCKQTGSWSQYGLFTIGDINDTFGSAGFLYQPGCENENVTFDPIAHKHLKFSNTIPGQFSSEHSPTNILSYYSKQTTSAYSGNDINLTNTNLNGIYVVNGSLNSDKTRCSNTASGTTTIYGEVPKGAASATGSKRIVLLVCGNVNITNNITYATNFTNIYEIPSLIVVAIPGETSPELGGKIAVSPSVRQLDGIYNAMNTFYDCAPTTPIAPYFREPSASDFKYEGVCAVGDVDKTNPSLTVNGAIIAGKTRFHRTNGTETVIDSTPAERIRYNPTVYLNSYAYQRTQQKDLKTILRREVAPRW